MASINSLRNEPLYKTALPRGSQPANSAPPDPFSADTAAHTEPLYKTAAHKEPLYKTALPRGSQPTSPLSPPRDAAAPKGSHFTKARGEPLYKSPRSSSSSGYEPSGYKRGSTPATPTGGSKSPGVGFKSPGVNGSKRLSGANAPTPTRLRAIHNLKDSKDAMNGSSARAWKVVGVPTRTRSGSSSCDSTPKAQV